MHLASNANYLTIRISVKSIPCIQFLYRRINLTPKRKLNFETSKMINKQELMQLISVYYRFVKLLIINPVKQNVEIFEAKPVHRACVFIPGNRIHSNERSRDAYTRARF